MQARYEVVTLIAKGNFMERFNMKKFIIAVCGIFISCQTTFAASREPKITDAKEAWDISGGYNTNVRDSFTYSKYIPDNQSDMDTKQKGTYGGGEGAIVAFIARSIYENGGYFCATQIQAANENWNNHNWLDYYDRNNDGAIYPCKTVCKPGWGGNKCEKQVSADNITCDDEDFMMNFFKKDKLGKRREKGKEIGRITENVEVFDIEHTNGVGNKDAYDVVLGVINVKKHGIVVAPVRIHGRRQGEYPNYRSRIKDVQSNNSSILLCATGYVEQNGDCVKSSYCTEMGKYDNMCPGYKKENYNEELHVLKTKEVNISIGNGLAVGGGNVNNKCTFFECKEGYALEQGDTTNAKCVPCGNDNRSGIVGGVCFECKETGQIFDATADNRCMNATPYTKAQMFENNNKKQCWLETDPDEFCKCVTGKECPQ